MQAVATLAASPFLAAPPNMTYFAIRAVMSPVPTGLQFRPPGALVIGASLTPRLSTALGQSSIYVASMSSFQVWGCLFI